MLQLIASLRPGARVLDLGAASGSFATAREDITIVRADLEPPSGRGPGQYVSADAARLPFRNGAFDLVISNHSLEHFPELEASVREIGRVLAPGGGLYVAVPDATTLTDRIYRWLGRGGGHVNAFRNSGEVAGLVERLTGLPLRGTFALASGLSFLNAHNFKTRPPRKIALFAFGNERFLALLLWCLRAADRAFGTRLAHYGWSYYFGSAVPPQPAEFWANVCVRCGSAHSADYLRDRADAWRKSFGLESYRCPQCGGYNLFTNTGRGASRSPAQTRS